MKFVQDGTLHLMLPMYRANRVDHYVVMLESASGQFITGRIETHADAAVFDPNTFDSIDHATTDAYMRADIQHMPWEQLFSEWAARRTSVGGK